MRRRRKYENAAAVPVPRLERRTPAAGPGSLERDVVVPLAQSVITGLVVAVLAGLLATWAGAARPVLIGSAAGALVLAAVWGALLLVHTSTLWVIESVLHTDLDRNGAIGAPREPVTVEVVDRHQNRICYVSVPLSDEQLEALARAVLAPGAVFSRRALPEGLVSADQYGELVATLARAGLLTARGAGPEAGFALTPAGRSWLRRYL